MQDKVVLCGASAYEEKFYLNEGFISLPNQVKEELKIMCVLYTQEIGGVIMLEYHADGTLTLRTEALENDYQYDEIASTLKIGELQREKKTLFEELELYYKMVFLGQKYEEK